MSVSLWIPAAEISRRANEGSPRNDTDLPLSLKSIDICTQFSCTSPSVANHDTLESNPQWKHKSIDRETNGTNNHLRVPSTEEHFRAVLLKLEQLEQGQNKGGAKAVAVRNSERDEDGIEEDEAKDATLYFRVGVRVYKPKEVEKLANWFAIPHRGGVDSKGRLCPELDWSVNLMAYNHHDRNGARPKFPVWTIVSPCAIRKIISSLVRDWFTWAMNVHEVPGSASDGFEAVCTSSEMILQLTEDNAHGVGVRA
ncbi:hypothetical protein PHJA_001315300 [Phtheirospermum japonicum]|uniref:Uncharacterized protein n=1 Tax=Phtheirospermum japonicum TaxID=374723 RepID=A0A830C6K4_9LAMI|nr:hypothetical protein PHJA_001315300 [Phtheirospermum japonicum]